jgi:hypothetical protein
MADGLKDRNLQAYYEDSIAMYKSKGWEYFVMDLKRLYDAANTLEGVKSNDDLHFRLGQVDIIKTIVAQPAALEAAYDELLASEE